MKNKVTLIVSLLVGILISIPIYGFVGIPNLWDILTNLHLKYLPYYLLTVFIIYTTLVFRWKIIIDAGNVRIPYGRLFLYKVAGYAVSYITPMAHLGGEPVRGMLLKRDGLSAQEGMSTVLIDKSIEFATDIILGCIGLFVLLSTFSFTQNSYVFILALVVSGFVLIIMFYYSMLKGKYFFMRFFKFIKLHRLKRMQNFLKQMTQTEDNMLAFFKNHKRAFRNATLIQFSLWFLMFFEYKFLLLMLGVDLPMIHVFLVFAIIGVAYIMPVPAALGTMEAGNVGVLALSNTKSSVGLAVSIIVRLKDLLITAIGLGFLAYIGFTWKKINKIKKIKY